MFGRDHSPFSPLPGTRRAPRGLFLDRWGTLLESPSQPPCQIVEQIVFTERSLDALFRAHQEGWLLYLIGNEDDVARGRVTDEQWKELQAATLHQLTSHGVAIHRDYTCVDDPAHGVDGHRADSVYRLPNTGAFYHAAHNDGIDLGQSWVVGDSTLELVAGWRASCRTLGLASGEGLGDGAFHVDPDRHAQNLAQGLYELLGLAHAR